MLDVSIYMAFAAGLISFVSPCVLPLVPGYISFVSGVAFAEIKEKKHPPSFLSKEKRIVLINSLFFVTGFSLVFTLLGASATWIGAFLSSKIPIMSKIGGTIIILFGVYKIGLFRPQIFYREARFNVRRRKFGYAGAMIIGAAFAFGWTPCIGPILGVILTYAGTLENVNQGMFLLLVYSLGLGVPFLLTTLGINQFWRFFRRVHKYLGLLEVASGVIMIVLGIMIYSNRLILIQGWLPFLNQFAL
jgi:cytochrome c-type biogenesis protein